MRFKKLSLIILFLSALLIVGCDEVTIDNTFVENIWQEVKKVTELDSSLPMPQIDFKDFSTENYNLLGIYSPTDQHIEIYLKCILTSIWRHRSLYMDNDYFRLRNVNINERQGEALIYNTIAHEMLHHAITLKEGEVWNHKIMKDRGYLQLVLIFISRHFELSPEDIQQTMSLELLDYAIRLDTEKERPLTKKAMTTIILKEGESVTIDIR